MTRTLRVLGWMMMTALLAMGVGAQGESQSAQKVEQLQYPEPDIGALALEIRRDIQLKGASELGVPHDFSFTDELENSGIEFVHKVTEDTTKAFIPVHYDHGNGISVADVDGDGLLDIYFLTQTGSNELWKNLGGGKFRNITAAAGVEVADRVSVGGSFADWDNDGDPDLFVTTVRQGNMLFRNDGKGRFTDISKKAGVDHVAHSSGAVFFDYDRDGLLDLYVTNVGVYTIDKQGPGPYWIGREDAFIGHRYPERTETSILYRNLGDGRMEDVSEKTGLVDPGWSGDAAFTDLNEDGFLDLYVLNMQGEDHYWQNVEGKTFKERSKELFPLNPWGAMGIGFFDYNNDGLMDLMMTDMHSDMTELSPIDREKAKARVPQAEPGAFIYGNAFYKNLGDEKFVEVSDELGAENYWPWGISIADLNADGFQDIFIGASMSFPFRYGINSVLLNDRGQRFHDSEFILGVEPRRGGRTHMVAFRLDCAGEDQGHEYCEGREGIVEILGTIGTRSAVLFDLDEDGDLDIVTCDFGAPPQILISDLAQRHDIKYLKIGLVGKSSNRDGLGAKVKVKAGGQEYLKMYDGRSGYLSQSSMPLYFGLGGAERVERIEVRWPSGVVQTVEENIPLNDLLVIREP